MKFYPVIMAGGSGTRFWPLSRQSRPKQFLPLASEQPLITDTAKRLEGLAPLKDVYVVCGKAHRAGVQKGIRGMPARNVLLEPMARNTAPALALAVLHVSERNSKGIVAALPADHYVRDVARFQETLTRAVAVAADGFIVTVGIKPTRPETGFGYLRRGERLTSTSFRVQAFVEKPDLGRAREYVQSGEYYWNGGIFVFRVDVMWESFRRHMPDLFASLETLRKALRKKRYAQVLPQVFSKMPVTSFDYGVAEKAENMAVVPGDFGWSDVGSFEATGEIRAKDAHGNVVAGEGAVVVESNDCVVLAGRRPVSVLGMSGVVVVDAGDAVLVVPKSRSQEVRRVVEILKARKWERYL